MVLVYALIFLGFVLGVMAVVAAEALGLLWILKRLRIKAIRDQARISSSSSATSLSSRSSAQIDPHQSLNSALKKEGVVWVLEPDKVSKFWLENSSKEHKKKKELLEVTPVRKYGKVMGDSLVLTEHEGLDTTIQLKQCMVEAVSSTTLSAKKWAKKFPIKVESKTSMIYHGSKTLYIYLETSWEKEAWCKSLRVASCDQSKKLEWFTQLHEEFHSYLTSLNIEYQFLTRPSVGSTVDTIERASKPDGSSSKVRQFLKKIAKKPPRVGSDNKSAWTSLSARDERKNIERLHACQDEVLATGLTKASSTGNHLRSSMLDNAPSLSSTMSRPRSQSQIYVSSDADADEKFGIDEGALCWNLLISRLFFDVKGNAQMKRSMQERIQRTLSNMRTPSYVGEVICTNINMGNGPPRIIGMRVLPMEMSEVCALEVDIEYSGSALFEIETRLEVGELELHKGTEGSNPESSTGGAVPSDLLEGLEYFDKQLNHAEGMNDLQEPEHVDVNTDVSKGFNRSNTSSSTPGSKLKSILNTVAKHVSQVPLTLALRVASLRGTLRLQIKAPPSDQLWYGFTCMPDMDLNMESSVGERKITNAHVALFLINRLKATIRETLVLPNCESTSITWMLAEKDDWVPRNVAPFIWNNNQESGNETLNSIDANNQPFVGLKTAARTSSVGSELRLQNQYSAESNKEPARKSDSVALPLSSPSSMTIRSSKSYDQLTAPLLENDKPQETIDWKGQGSFSFKNNNTHEASEMEDIPVYQSPAMSVVMDDQTSSFEQDDSRSKKVGRKERMLDLRKRMSEKFEEKKRHIGEKSRHIVEKMRGP